MLFIHTYVKGLVAQHADTPAPILGQIITMNAQDAERIIARRHDEQTDTTFTLTSTAPFTGNSDDLHWIPSWAPGEEVVMYAEAPVRVWAPKYESEKLSTKILLLYNADRDEDTVVKTYTLADEHLAEQHADSFSETILSPSEFVRVIHIKEMQSEIVDLHRKIAQLTQQLANAKTQR